MSRIKETILISVAIFILACVGFATHIVAANAILDGNSNPTEIIENEASTGSVMRVKGDATTGSINVIIKGGSATNAVVFEPLTTYEFKSCSIAAGATSGTCLNPSAESTYFLIYSLATQTARFAINATASASSGFTLDGGVGLDLPPATFTSLSVYNSGSVTATFTAIIGR